MIFFNTDQCVVSNNIYLGVYIYKHIYLFMSLPIALRVRFEEKTTSKYVFVLVILHCIPTGPDPIASYPPPSSRIRTTIQRTVPQVLLKRIEAGSFDDPAGPAGNGGAGVGGGGAGRPPSPSTPVPTPSMHLNNPSPHHLNASGSSQGLASHHWDNSQGGGMSGAMGTGGNRGGGMGVRGVGAVGVGPSRGRNDGIVGPSGQHMMGNSPGGAGVAGGGAGGQPPNKRQRNAG